MDENIVTPNLEYAPEREYVHNNEGNIICRAIISKKIIFELRLTKKQADILMEDLYYGEYTGA